MSRKTRVDGWREDQDGEPGPAEQAVDAGDVFPFAGGTTALPPAEAADVRVNDAASAGAADDALNWSGQLHNADEVRSNPHVL